MRKRLNLLALTIVAMGLLSCSPGFSKNSDSPSTGKISGKTVVAGVASLLIWPGIGQAVNNDKSQKVLTHALLGILPPYRFWSGYDALVDRQGGYWKGRI